MIKQVAAPARARPPELRMEAPCLPGCCLHPRFFDGQLGSAVGAIDYVRGSGNQLLMTIRGIDFGDCIASSLGWPATERDFFIIELMRSDRKLEASREGSN